MEPKISVIVCERNSEKFIEECINSVMNQSYHDFKLIVVDDFSTDKTKEKIKKIKEKYSIKLIELKRHSGISKARNAGIKNASGEIIAFIDADAAAEKNWLEEILNGFTDEKTVSVGGPNLVPKNAGKNEKIFDELLGLISGVGSGYAKNQEKITEVKHNPSCNSAYRKKILDKMNGFNESLSSNEDPELDFRLAKKGYKIKFNPKAVVWHHRKDSSGKIFSQAFWFGLGRMQAIKIHFEMADWFRLVPFFSLLLTVILFFFGFYSEKFEFFFYFVFLLFLSMLLISFIAVVKFRRLSLRYFLFLLSWFFGYGLGMIKGVFR